MNSKKNSSLSIIGHYDEYKLYTNEYNSCSVLSIALTVGVAGSNTCRSAGLTAWPHGNLVQNVLSASMWRLCVTATTNSGHSQDNHINLDISTVCATWSVCVNSLIRMMVPDWIFFWVVWHCSTDTFVGVKNDAPRSAYSNLLDAFVQDLEWKKQGVDLTYVIKQHVKRAFLRWRVGRCLPIHISASRVCCLMVLMTVDCSCRSSVIR